MAFKLNSCSRFACLSPEIGNVSDQQFTLLTVFFLVLFYFVLSCSQSVYLGG